MFILLMLQIAIRLVDARYCMYLEWHNVGPLRTMACLDFAFPGIVGHN